MSVRDSNDFDRGRGFAKNDRVWELVKHHPPCSECEFGKKLGLRGNLFDPVPKLI